MLDTSPLRYSNGRGFVEDASIETIADSYGTPVYVYSESVLRRRARELLLAYREHGLDYAPLYALKVNSNPAIISVLAEEGIGADCANVREMEIALTSSVPSNDVWLSEPFVGAKALSRAVSVSARVNLFEAEAVDLLLAEEAPKFVALRYFCENPIDGVESGFHLGASISKFGISLSQMHHCFLRLIEHGVDEVGFHAMMGSRISKLSSFHKLYAHLASVVSDLEERLGQRFYFVNLGGGLDIDYKRIGKSVCPSDVLSVARSYFPQNNIITEFGRWMTGTSGIIVTRVKGIKRRSSSLPILCIDCGMQTLARPVPVRREACDSSRQAPRILF